MLWKLYVVKTAYHTISANLNSIRDLTDFAVMEKGNAMAEYIDKEALRDALYDADAITMNGVKILNQFPSSDVEPVKHGRWELTTNSFYYDTFDESCELCVYIVANCSECSGKHPNSYQVFSKTLYAPDDADDDFRFDQKVEEEKALLEFRNKKYEFAYYCPNCGAKMDGE